MKPSLCRIVIYKFTADPDDPDERDDTDVAAMITAVSLDGKTVQLTVFPPGEDPFPILTPDEGPEWLPFSATPKQGHWRWPDRV